MTFNTLYNYMANMIKALQMTFYKSYFIEQA